MDSETIERLKELEAKATKGPWKPVRSCTCGHLRAEHNYRENPREEWTDDDLAFIAAARNAMPDLLAAAEENVRLREALERIGRQDYDDIDGSFTEAAARIARAALNGGSK